VRQKLQPHSDAALIPALLEVSFLPKEEQSRHARESADLYPYFLALVEETKVLRVNTEVFMGPLPNVSSVLTRNPAFSLKIQ
jgi:hypothetical protein